MEETIPPRKVLLRTISKGEPIFFAQSINQIFAWRGIGKTCLGFGLMSAFATGGKFLNWEVPERVNVLYVEGEMPQAQLQERWRQIVGKTDGRTHLVTIDKQPEHMIPSLATAIGMLRVEATLAELEAQGNKIDVLFLDSISTLFNIGANDEDNWLIVQAWLIKLRSKGLCIFFFHHAGKSGMSRSHSKSEDMLDVSIKLDIPKEQELGIMHAVMIYDKSRHGISERPADIKMRRIHSDSCACRSAHVIGCQGDRVKWEFKPAMEAIKAQAYEMFEEGISVSITARQLGQNLGTVKTWRTNWAKDKPQTDAETEELVN